MKRRIPPLFAHRGCSAAAPENTLAAFKLATDLGIPGIELDVRLARSGEVVVIHDGDLNRVAGIDVPVSAIDLPELKCVDVGGWFDPRFSGERVPLLDEVFDLIGGSVFLDIELKAARGDERRLAQAVADRIVSARLTAHCLVSSFNPLAVRHFARSCPHVPTAVIYADHPGLPRLMRHGFGCLATRCDIVKPHWKQTGRSTMIYHKTIRRRLVAAWTVNDESTARSLFARGVDAIISDVPETLLHLVE